MIDFVSDQHPRLITGFRLLAECLDNCPDGWLPSELAATAVVLMTVALHVIAEILESFTDVQSDMNERK